MNHPKVIYGQRDSATPQAELDALCNVYRLALDSAIENASRRAETSGDTKPRNTKGASHVDQQPG